MCVCVGGSHPVHVCVGGSHPVQVCVGGLIPCRTPDSIMI